MIALVPPIDSFKEWTLAFTTYYCPPEQELENAEYLLLHKPPHIGITLGVKLLKTVKAVLDIVDNPSESVI